MAALIAVILLVGVIAGLAYSTTAVGYGTLVILPLIAMGIQPHLAVGATLVSVTAVSLAAGLMHGVGRKSGHIRLSVLIPLIAGGSAGAYGGSLLSQSMLPDKVLTSGIAILILFGGAAYLLKPRLAALHSPSEKALPWMVLAAGLLGGLSTGAFGIGWGYTTVPTLIILGVDTGELLGSSLLARTFMSGSGTVNYLRTLSGDMLPVILILVATGVTASFAGHRLSRNIRPARLRHIIMGWTMVLAGWLLVRNLGLL